MAGAISTRPRLAFTIRDIPRPSRRRALHTLIDRRLLPVEPLAGNTPEVDLVKWRLPGASILAGTFADVRQNGEPERAAAADVFFGINVAGAAPARQHGRQLILDAGDAMAVDLHGGPFAVLRPTANRLIGVRIPRCSLPVGDDPAGDTALRLVPSHTPALRLVQDPRYASRTISSIADDAGFGELSYFNRTFRRRYAFAPSQARQPLRRPHPEGSESR